MSAQDAQSAALAYAAAGWPVFPTRPDDPSCPGGKDCGCKTPFPGTRGCLDASTDPDVIRAWWRRWPDANVAIATGAPGPDVLDVDVKPDGDGWVRHSTGSSGPGLLTGAKALVRTPSGGLHTLLRGQRAAQREAAASSHRLPVRGRLRAGPAEPRPRPAVRAARPPGGRDRRISTGRPSAGCSSRPSRPPGRAGTTLATSASSPRGSPPSRRATGTTACSGPPAGPPRPGTATSATWWPRRLPPGWPRPRHAAPSRSAARKAAER